jgi:hypothetical protein
MNKSTHFSGQPILGQIVKLIPRPMVERLARKHGTDRYYKRFKTHEHLVAMLFAIYARCTSLREVASGMMGSPNALRHVGVRCSPRRSTLSDANVRRDYRVFEAIHRDLYRRYASVLPDSRGETWLSKLFIIDSTTISLFQAILKTVGRTPGNGRRKGGAKAHAMVKADEDVPCLVCVTSASTHDHTFLGQINLPPGSIVTFDKGYVDYELYNLWTERQISFVTRLKTSAVWHCVEERPITEAERDAGVLEDKIVMLGHATQPKKVQARLVIYRHRDEKTQKERTFQFLTNNLELDALTVAEIYRKRWQIEMLFKRLKQNYPLRNFLGDNENAIKIQIWCALIADLLLKVILRDCRRKWSFANLASMVRLHLMHYINLRSFLNNPEKAILQATSTGRDIQWSLFPP